MLIALLIDDVICGVQELDDCVVIFVDDQSLAQEQERIERIAAPFLSGTISYESIPHQNWHEEWKKTIRPIQIGGFWIRPSWNNDEVPAAHIDIIIDPKMSFGTGLHASTRLMLAAIRDVLRPGDRILDAGTGTGILAIAALKSGASRATAFDNDPICKGDAEDNAKMNGLEDRFEMFVGTQEIVPVGIFDMVLANIDREALKTMLPALKNFMAVSARLGMAGLLLSERESVLGEISQNGLALVREATEGEWWSVWVMEK